MTAESGNLITNVTRVEILNWLLFKCVHEAATKNNSGIFKPTGVHHPVNIRRTLIEPLPEKSIGNFSMIIKILTKNGSDMKPESFITEFKKQKMHFKGLKNIETAFGICSNVYSDTIDVQEHQRTIDGAYICTSMCRYLLYDIDFGLGKPVQASIAGKVGKNSFLLMDTALKYLCA
ncbi:acylsugar acyltransferase 3-like protein [Tanacetum coccineum]